MEQDFEGDKCLPFLFIMKQTIIFLILILSICTAQATQIDIYYPHNNTTTDIYYATSSGYNHTENNSMSGDFSVLILKNQIVADDIVSDPKKVYSHFSLLIYTLIFGIIIIGIARVVSR